MHPVLAKTFCGLSASYYTRQFIFGLMFPIFILLMHGQSQDDQALRFGTLLMLAINTLLYPYSRFVYESIVSFVIGQNVFLVNALLMLAVKLMTMLLCWVCAIFIAPIGLAYLYIRHSRSSD